LSGTQIKIKGLEQYLAATANGQIMGTYARARFDWLHQVDCQGSCETGPWGRWVERPLLAEAM
jgi:hypothetical protein